MRKINFVAETPLDGPSLVDHVCRVLGRDLPELPDFSYSRPGAIRIIANGPSATVAPLDGPTCAVNGALGLFTDRGLAPTYWAACDPQEQVVDFLRETHYLVASKCHPRVFERLINTGCRVTVWHVAEDVTALKMAGYAPVSSYSTITLTVFEVLERLGWRAFETWGWDGCFLDGRNHAVDQRHAAEVIDLEIDGLTFKTTGSWAMEAQDALIRLTDYPWPVTICGDGMIAAALRHVWAPILRQMAIEIARQSLVA